MLDAHGVAPLAAARRLQAPRERSAPSRLAEHGVGAAGLVKLNATAGERPAGFAD